MWEIEGHLQKDEKVEYSGQPVYWGYIGYFFLAFILIWSIIFPIIILAYVYLDKNSQKYVLSNKRVARRFGIISEDFKSATFKHITSVRVRQNVFGKIFHFGDVIVDTAGSGRGVDFVWKYVKNPVEVRKMIEKKIA